MSLRVIADHVRTATMLVADGVRPGNEKRGYVLRRILRRSIRNLRLLSGDESFHMHDLTAVAIDAMGDQYPELRADADKIHSIIDAEEKNFADTLRAGTTVHGRSGARGTGGTVFSGADAFQLHDTYGFPLT